MAKKRKTRNPYEYFSVAADVMALRRRGGGSGVRGGQLSPLRFSPSAYEVLLIQRKNPPFQYCWALPGGFLDRDEDALTAAKRELREETGLRAKKLHEFGAFSDPDRDPRGRCVTISFHTVVSGRGSDAVAGDDAKELQWFPVSKLPPLAFDHREMIRKGWKNFTSVRRKKLSLAK